MNAHELAELCLSAQAAGPGAYANEYIDENGSHGIAVERAAWRDLQAQRDPDPPIIRFPLKLTTLGAAQLAAIGTLLGSEPPSRVGITSLGRSVLEGCGTVSWLLDNTVTSEVRHRRAWLLWAVAEGNAAMTAAADAGRTGAMAGSPQRLEEIQAAIHSRLGLRIERSDRAKPKDWRLGGISLPGPGEFVAKAVDRWFGGADGRILYSQVSRQAHSDVLIALALVDDTLAITREGHDDMAPTVLLFWANAWTLVLSYLGLESRDFEDWRRRMENTIRPAGGIEL
jgi:hypothetical protein